MKLAYHICVDDQPYRGTPQKSSETPGGALAESVYRHQAEGLTGVSVEIHEFLDRATGGIKCFTRVLNHTGRSIRISRADAGIAVANSGAKLHYYSSNWGREYDPLSMLLTETHSIQVVSGRSGKGYAPWVGLECEAGYFSMTVAWSGNWQASTLRYRENLYAMMGIYEGDFFIDVADGGHFDGAAVYIAASKVSMEDACFLSRQFFIDHVSIIDKDKWETLPLIYNTWWCYEDKLVNAARCVANAEIARDVGITNFLMDAGWFGNNDHGSTWFEKRGDWNIENTAGFPQGIRWLGETINGLGVDFGIWCEIEAVGEHAKLNTEHPGLLARRFGRSLGYVCMGSEAARQWALDVVGRLVAEYGAKWIKFDFNLDPNQGCNCEEHDHGRGDGLHAHYMGYYALMEELHRRYPDLILENCCSGGLRMDYGVMSRMHCTFLSDPDYVEHHFQCFWGATSFLHPAACYHFTQSESIGAINGEPKNPISADMTKEKFDFYMRSGMLSIIGFSYDLPGWPQWCLDRLREHIQFYKGFSGKYILRGQMHRLTGQALRQGGGDRWQAYQFSAADGTARIFAFRLDGAPGARTIYPKGLNADREYNVTYADKGTVGKRYGRDLMENGIVLDAMPEESSEIIRID